MATSDRDDFTRYMAGLSKVEAPRWTDAEDLGRLSRSAATRRFGDVGAFLEPSGNIRLSGAGVAGHSAPFEAIGAIVSSTQLVVTAIGAALEGFKAPRGAFTRELLRRTALSLTASPAAGSIVLSFGPEDSQVEAEYVSGEVPLDASPEPLVDRAFVELFDLLQQAEASDPDAEEFSERLGELGPRVASSLRTWSDSLSSAHIDAELSWSDANANRRFTTVARSQSAWISAMVAGKMLDARPSVIVGTVRTVSDLTSWVIDVEEGARTSVHIEDLAPTEISPVRVGDRVRLDVLMQERTRPGLPSTFTYSAVSVSVLKG